MWPGKMMEMEYTVFTTIIFWEEKIKRWEYSSLETFFVPLPSLILIQKFIINT